ncbi:MAG: LysM peptidoglycan-binding domain-containing protein [Caldilineaceae bacterium]|nr:LysM peptidoglycan-binding domain-containing protein [Caldilineaceae bacterium]
MPEDEVQGYYRRAAELALTKNDVEALAVIEHGLRHFNAAELHLLAALIHRKRNEYDQMRRHVAAIPVDDVLRPEAEWLLRSHQERQRALRQAVHEKKSKKQPPIDTAAIQISAADQFLLDEFGRYRSERRKDRSYGWLVSLPLLALLIALAWWQAPLVSEWTGLVFLPTAEAIQPAVEADGASPQSTERMEAPAAVEPEPTPDPTPLPTSTPLPNLAEAPIALASVEADAAPEPIAASGTANALIALTAAERGFDLITYLKLVGRGDLAEFDIAARRQEEALVLTGVVSSTQARADLIAQAAKVPGVTEVNAIDLLIRLPETYIVRPNDTLWSIAFTLYGDGLRWQEILEANRELLRGGTLLSPGQELVVPPL